MDSMPEYWAQACAALARRDAVLKRMMRVQGDARLSSRGDAFGTLARSIVGQQISVKAAESVWARLATGLGHKVRPQTVLACDVDALRQFGLSQRKAQYLHDLATHFIEGDVRPRRWRAMDDEAIIAELTAVRGIGRWTAEMFLIFHLLRPNVFPLDDIGLLRGLSLAYAGGEPVSRSQAREIADLWSPWATVGTWYIWRSLDPLPVAY
ncbi:MAG: DNA-3-methyladenine glycosylase 2 family protein [Betaproteobacteria bacterium]|nr:DNA-3-methyladenine glycosylase 2 family protein [Betaproteobacteria bacterium]